MSNKLPQFYYEEFYRSDLLKLKIYQRYNLWYGLNFGKDKKPMYVPDMNWDNLKIRLEGVHKDLNRRELKTYIDVMLNNPVRKIKREVENFEKSYPLIIRS
jgi:hypothetical protein